MTTVRLDGLRGREEMASAARSSLYRRLAEGVAFPTPTLVEAVAAGRFLAALRSDTPALPFDLPLDRDTEAALADPGLAHDELQQEYIRLFEVGPGRPPCPLYEGSHRSGRMKTMEELVRFYEHFGLQADPGDRPDHLCAELEFMHYLAFKQTVALRDDTGSEPYRLAQRDFLRRRLCRWLPLLPPRLTELHAPRYYVSLLRLTEEMCRRDAGFLDGGGAKPDTHLRSLPD